MRTAALLAVGLASILIAGESTSDELTLGTNCSAPIVNHGSYSDLVKQCRAWLATNRTGDNFLASSSDDSSHTGHASDVVLAPVVVLGIGVLIRHVLAYSGVPLPYTVSLLLLGFLIGGLLQPTSDRDHDDAIIRLPCLLLRRVALV